MKETRIVQKSAIEARRAPIPDNVFEPEMKSSLTAPFLELDEETREYKPVTPNEQYHSTAGPRERIGRELGNLSDRKGVSYGDSITTVRKMLEVLYPDGIPVSAYDHALVLVRMLDKINRIANGNDDFDEDPYADIAGYCLLQIAKHRGLE